MSKIYANKIVLNFNSEFRVAVGYGPSAYKSLKSRYLLEEILYLPLIRIVVNNTIVQSAGFFPLYPPLSKLSSNLLSLIEINELKQRKFVRPIEKQKISVYGENQGCKYCKAYHFPRKSSATSLVWPSLAKPMLIVF